MKMEYEKSHNQTVTECSGTTGNQQQDKFNQQIDKGNCSCVILGTHSPYALAKGASRDVHHSLHPKFSLEMFIF